MNTIIIRTTPMQKSLQKIKDFLFDTLYKRSGGLEGPVAIFTNPLNEYGSGTIFLTLSNKTVGPYVSQLTFRIYGHVYNRNGVSLRAADLGSVYTEVQIDDTFCQVCEHFVLGIYTAIRKYWTAHEAEMLKQLEGEKDF